MCGKGERLFKTKVEGTILNVCGGCSKFGKIIAPTKVAVSKKVKKAVVKEEEAKKEIVFAIVDDYDNRIKKAREAMGIKQEEFAKKISEKESLVHKIETGHFEPNISLAMKIERFLKIKLIEQYEESYVGKKEAKDEGFTIGDILKTK